MSEWTHVAGHIRVNALIFDKSLIEDYRKALEDIIGKPVSYEELDTKKGIESRDQMSKIKFIRLYLELVIWVILGISSMFMVASIIETTIGGLLFKELPLKDKTILVGVIVYIILISIYFIRLRVLKILDKLLNE